ncbi:acetyl-CoA synthetase [Desulfonatronum thiosulfatophilum]|uniref:Acetyl-CoA synthetase n=1 Tax=Desulfonatronum thiosulfatophilum TaxID=617002 RepID=A0A1G6BIP0_9BACT|nr:AMP-binding protein [Desulfonatronum thiosulfatophilum]SDB20491.1 acetyl-CoA synthetase [Desulfonatronum thiosulfatophilum]
MNVSSTSYEDFVKSFQIDIPENYNFAFDFLAEQARQDPDRPAMIHVDDAGVRKDYTLGFFELESNKLANALRKLGLGKGDRVMLILHRRVEFWISMLALHKIGAVAVPSPALLTAKDIVYRVNFARIKAAIVDGGVAPVVQAALADCPGLRTLIHVGSGEATLPARGWLDYAATVSEAAETFPRPEDAAGGQESLLIFFSSGTTGPPKMVEHVHTYPLGHYTTGIHWHDLRPGDIHLTLADTGWGKAVWGKFYGQWMAGAVVFVHDFRGKFDPAKLLALLAEHKVTSFCGPPTVYRFLIRQDFSGLDLSSLRHCTTAGELLNDGVFHAWKEATGLAIYEGYGQTETTLQVATFPFMTPKPGSIGKPSPGWDVVLLNDDQQPCAPGEEGEICIRLDGGNPLGLFTGYLDEPEKTAQSRAGGYYHTGDKAWTDEEGYLWFLGRVDDLIKSSGYRIGPFEVESVLITHPAVVEAAVTGIPDPVRGQAVKATVVLAPGYAASEALTKELQEHVKSLTAPYKYPRVVEYLDELPKTISGKIKRAEIRTRDIQEAGKAG